MTTRQYTSPTKASKKERYVCPDCDKEVRPIQGLIKMHHFRHKTDTLQPCHYYDRPSESQLHKNGKELLKTMLEKKIKIEFARACLSCDREEVYEIPEMTESSSLAKEYRFEFNGGKRIADLAYLDDNKLFCIFEIYATHKTAEDDRPEPWFEIDAKQLIQTAEVGCAPIPCIRRELCDGCNERKRKQQEEYYTATRTASHCSKKRKIDPNYETAMVEMVKKNGFDLQHVVHQTEKICLAAMNANGIALKFVKEQTPEICLAAVKKCHRAYKYVKEKTLKIQLAAVQGVVEDSDCESEYDSEEDYYFDYDPNDFDT